MTKQRILVPNDGSAFCRQIYPHLLKFFPPEETELILLRVGHEMCIRDRLSEVPQDKPVVLYCRSGNRSGQAAQILEQAGYTQIYDLGGIVAWAEQGYPVE